MSFLGAIGNIMILAKTTALHLLSGKSVDRTIRPHEMVDIALNTVFLDDTFGSTGIDSDSTKQLLKGTINVKVDVDNITSSDLNSSD